MRRRRQIVVPFRFDQAFTYGRTVRMADTGITGALTDGSGIGTWTRSKVLKDFVVDALKTGAAALVGVGVVGVPTTTAQAYVVGTALIGAVISALYRAILRWGES